MALPTEYCTLSQPNIRTRMAPMASEQGAAARAQAMALKRAKK